MTVTIHSNGYIPFCADDIMVTEMQIWFARLVTVKPFVYYDKCDSLDARLSIRKNVKFLRITFEMDIHIFTRIILLYSEGRTNIMKILAAPIFPVYQKIIFKVETYICHANIVSDGIAAFEGHLQIELFSTEMRYWIFFAVTKT